MALGSPLLCQARGFQELQDRKQGSGRGGPQTDRGLPSVLNFLCDSVQVPQSLGLSFSSSKIMAA